jgi:hypothetical protein
MGSLALRQQMSIASIYKLLAYEHDETTLARGVKSARDATRHGALTSAEVQKTFELHRVRNRFVTRPLGATTTVRGVP